MPVIPQVNEGLKIGLKYTPSAPPQLVGAIQSGSQAMTASMGLMPMFPVPIPVIPVGAAAAMALTQIEAMMFKGFEDASNIAEKLMNQYYKDLDKAKDQRKSSEEELYQSEIDSQNQMKEDVKILESDIATLNKEIDAITIVQQKEMTEYKATVFDYKEKAKNADLVGNVKERDMWIDKISEHDDWLGEILLMVVEIIQKKIEIMNKERELETKKELIALKIEREWSWLEDHATDFDVIVPYHPDIPMPPNIPMSGIALNESPLVKYGRQIFAKWVVAPMVPPIGLVVASIQIMIQSFSSSAPAPAAAKAEAQADSLILQLGGVI